MSDESILIDRVTETGEALVEFVDPGGYYNKHDAAYVHALYGRAREFVDAVNDLGFIPVLLERRTDT